MELAYYIFSNMKVLFSGGGTLGPVTPLLAMHEVIQEAHPAAQFLWVGTKKGPEKELIEQIGMPFTTVAAGKLRRYFSLENFTDPFKILLGFFQSLNLLHRERPDVCISAGGFVSVPIHWAAWFLGIPTWIHQQDIQVGLANSSMAFPAKVITTATEAHKKLFSKKKTIWLGNPVRRTMLDGDKARAVKQFGLDPHVPIIFATGGGTGSLKVNQMVVEAVQHLKGFAQVLHLSGKERPQKLVRKAEELYGDIYQVHQFFTTEMKDAYAAADIVVSRGGFGTLTEVAAVGKPAIIIPKVGQQEKNVQFLDKAGAIVYVSERSSDGNFLAKTTRMLLEDKTRRKQLVYNLQRFLPRAKDEDILGILDRLTS